MNYRVALLLKILITYLFRRFSTHWLTEHLQIHREVKKGMDLSAFQKRFQQAQADGEVVHEVKIYTTQLEVLRHISSRLVQNETFRQYRSRDGNAFDHIIAKQVGLLEKGNKQGAPTSKQLHNWLQGQHEYYKESFKKILANKGINYY